ncbi:MAG: HD domain-containing protein [Alicyclobacillus macrosporangiidus]|uniref:HD-GYP domain-containing protein n=1 Tax=Alicyclobacillus macrosporangiidus TaxID=392015 RepID=UPI0026F0FDCE|nr:HD domain-containing phosphohydrolase [Alicyclobacillus macrosporangiidus]MCL6600412.1 HD domain-containing protein [Alicyclobacillus macrosporangiidus]
MGSSTIINSRLSLEQTEAIFESLIHVAEYADPDALDHVRRVSAYARFIAQSVLHWPEQEARRIGIAALVHDIGKVAIPRELLLKPGGLSLAERQYVQQHTVHGYRILDELQSKQVSRLVEVDSDLFELAKQVALHHHENWDGTGYPGGLAKDRIPTAAQVVKIADVIDALLSPRPYKLPQSWEQVRTQLLMGAGWQFDRALLYGLLDVEDEFVALVKSQLYTVSSA